MKYLIFVRLEHILDRKNVLCDCFGLVVWNSVDVAEATAGGVRDRVRVAGRVDDGAFPIRDGLSGVKLRGADVGHVGATSKIRHGFRIKQRRSYELGNAGLKMVPFPRQPLVESSPGGPATPSSPEAKRMEVPWSPSFKNLLLLLIWHCASRGERFILIALPLLIVSREVRLLATIRDGDHVRGLVNTTHQLSLVSTRGIVRIGWIEGRAVSAFSVGTICAV